MDNLCHTLAGAVLAEAGLRRRARLAVPALLVGANLPDVDALAYARDPLFALTVRRGWTHGVLALVLLPPLLTAALLAGERLLSRKPEPARSSWPALLVVATIAIVSHPLLDLLNTYGVRLLMPFSHRWFCADTLFIVDPWLWLLFGIGSAVSWWRRRQGLTPAAAERPARIALALAGGYLLAMGLGTVAGRRLVREAASRAGISSTQEMVAPVAADPFRRSVVLATADGYRVGSLSWLGSPHVALDPRPIPNGFRSAAVAAAAESKAGSAFLAWSRFPVAMVRREADGEVVRLYDLRYAGPDGRSWAAVEIRTVNGQR